MKGDDGNVSLSVILSSRVPECLRRRPAVVLERVARGGGETRWFFLVGAGELPSLSARLSPGSAVSFYFDDRIRRWAAVDDAAVAAVLDVVHASGEAVVGLLMPDGVTLDVEFVSGLGDLSDFVAGRTPGELFVGSYPARDDDGIHAVTLILPDRDGVVRCHPH